MFGNGYCWFGQCGSAQGHLRKNNVQVDDVFLFFGLFMGPISRERHHRIFGYMQIDCFGAPDAVRKAAAWKEPVRPHPHFNGAWDRNNTLYHSRGSVANEASDALRLTVKDGPLNVWRIPAWLAEFGLTYHEKPDRWLDGNRLDSAKRGQEFVCNIKDAHEARQWLDGIIREIEK